MRFNIPRRQLEAFQEPVSANISTGNLIQFCRFSGSEVLIDIADIHEFNRLSKWVFISTNNDVRVGITQHPPGYDVLSQATRNLLNNSSSVNIRAVIPILQSLWEMHTPKFGKKNFNYAIKAHDTFLSIDPIDDEKDVKIVRMKTYARFLEPLAALGAWGFMEDPELWLYGMKKYVRFWYPTRCHRSFHTIHTTRHWIHSAYLCTCKSISCGERGRGLVPFQELENNNEKESLQKYNHLKHQNKTGRIL